MPIAVHFLDLVAMFEARIVSHSLGIDKVVALHLLADRSVRFATPGHIPGSEQKRTFTILHCEAVFNLVLKNNEPLQSFGNAKPLVNEMAAPFVHETCLYAVFEYEAMDRSL
ncbi:hypothetical protein [Marinobacter nauticus]|uniref:hypothetical protein n=1 Tax=Marinobacter nauticus TaxID=2743 RepID=UPI001F358AF5|nr:hypothetical protein [Marinobacter nauticus]